MKTNEMRFYQLLRDFLTDYLIARRNFSDKTAKAYRQTLNLLRNYLREEKGINFDHMDFSCFTRNGIYDFLMWLKDTRKNSAQTLNLRLSSIKSFLKYCSEEDMELMPVYLDVAGIHSFKGAKNPCVEYLTPAQLKLLFSLPEITTRLGRRDRFFMIFAYETGARMQELLDLQLSGIVRSDSGVKVRIHGKGNKIRYVPLLGSTVKHLDSYLMEFHKSNPGNAFLFYTIHNAQKTQMKPGTVDAFLKKCGKLAHEADSTFPTGLHAHMFRHSIAMAMYKKGVPISYIRDFLGHSSIETTTVYSYSDEETITKALEAVDHEESDGNTSTKQKNWKGKEQFLLEYCGLS
ncbi:MAG: tyrosine-type recombinase/integrase [Eubacteriales bacterium]|nr:tyrosine-type recombinase/integrase [Eubacteriales bacterium]